MTRTKSGPAATEKSAADKSAADELAGTADESATDEPVGSDQATDGPVGESGDLERIRSLLFGGKVDDIGSQLADLAKQIAAVRKDFDKRLDVIESRLADEAQTRLGALEDEHRERLRASTELDDDLKKRARQMSRELKDQTSALRGEVATALTDVANQLAGTPEPKKR